MNTDQNDKDRSESKMMDHREMEDDLPAFAMGCQDREDADRISKHLSTCELCQTRLRSYEQTVGLLAHGIPRVDPPDSLKARLMHRIGEQPYARSAAHAKTSRSIFSFFRGFSASLAMASLVLIISLSTVNILQWRQSRAISDQLSAPLEIIKMKGTELSPHADGTFVIGQNHLHGVLVASDLPAIPSSQQFQLWLIRNGQKDSGGTFSTSPLGYGVMKVSSSRPFSEYQSATVTIEPFGGSPSPTGPELMAGTF